MTTGKSNPNNPGNSTKNPGGGAGNPSGGGGAGNPGGAGGGNPGGAGGGNPGGAGGGAGGAGNPGGAAAGNGRTFSPDRLVVHVPSAATLSSAAGEKKVNDLFRQFFGGKNLKPVEMVEKLGQRVQAKKVEGRATPEFEITPRPLSGTSGPTSGQSVAQTSLSERANAALADAEKRLDALKPMKTPSDPENLDALRAVTLTTYKRLVGELGFGGGLRGTRVERHFDLLIGVQPANGPIDLQPKSLLKKIEDAFSLKIGAEVKTTEDSANLANFRIVKENLFDIYRGWTGFKKEVENDFSELTAKLSRKLAVLDDEVTDVETAMDEAGYDANDRESDIIDSDLTSPKVTVDGLFLWVREFASEEGPELIEGGGAFGIEAAITTLSQLQTLVNALVTKPPIEDNNVKTSLVSLNNHLVQATALAKKITSPQ